MLSGARVRTVLVLITTWACVCSSVVVGTHGCPKEVVDNLARQLRTDISGLAQGMTDKREMQSLVERIRSSVTTEEWSSCISFALSMVITEEVSGVGPTDHVNWCYQTVRTAAFAADPCCNTTLRMSQCCVPRTITFSDTRVVRANPLAIADQCPHGDVGTLTSITSSLISNVQGEGKCDTAVTTVGSSIRLWDMYVHAYYDQVMETLGFGARPLLCLDDSQCSTKCIRGQCVVPWNDPAPHVAQYLLEAAADHPEKQLFSRHLLSGGFHAKVSPTAPASKQDIGVLANRIRKTLYDDGMCMGEILDGACVPPPGAASKVCNWDQDIGDNEEACGPNLLNGFTDHFCAECHGPQCEEVGMPASCYTWTRDRGECLMVDGEPTTLNPSHCDFLDATKSGEEEHCVPEKYCRAPTPTGVSPNLNSAELVHRDGFEKSCGGFCILKGYNDESRCTQVNSRTALLGAVTRVSAILGAKATGFLMPIDSMEQMIQKSGTVCDALAVKVQETLEKMVHVRAQYHPKKGGMYGKVRDSIDHAAYDMIQSAASACEYSFLHESKKLWDQLRRFKSAVRSYIANGASDVNGTNGAVGNLSRGLIRMDGDAFTPGDDTDYNHYSWQSNFKQLPSEGGYCVAETLAGPVECSGNHFDWIPLKTYVKGHLDTAERCSQGTCSVDDRIATAEDCREATQCTDSCTKCRSSTRWGMGYCYDPSSVSTDEECLAQGGELAGPYGAHQKCVLHWAMDDSFCDSSVGQVFRTCESLTYDQCSACEGAEKGSAGACPIDNEVLGCFVNRQDTCDTQEECSPASPPTTTITTTGSGDGYPAPGRCSSDADFINRMNPFCLKEENYKSDKCTGGCLMPFDASTNQSGAQPWCNTSAGHSWAATGCVDTTILSVERCTAGSGTWVRKPYTREECEHAVVACREEEFAGYSGIAKESECTSCGGVWRNVYSWTPATVVPGEMHPTVQWTPRGVVQPTYVGRSLNWSRFSQLVHATAGEIIGESLSNQMTCKYAGIASNLQTVACMCGDDTGVANSIDQGEEEEEEEEGSQLVSPTPNACVQEDYFVSLGQFLTFSTTNTTKMLGGVDVTIQADASGAQTALVELATISMEASLYFGELSIKLSFLGRQELPQDAVVRLSLQHMYQDFLRMRARDEGESGRVAAKSVEQISPHDWLSSELYRMSSDRLKRDINSVVQRKLTLVEEKYLVAMNLHGAIVGQVVGAPVAISIKSFQPEDAFHPAARQAIESTVCLPIDGSIPVDYEFYPKPDIGVFVASTGGIGNAGANKLAYRPLGLTSPSLYNTSHYICGSIALTSTRQMYVPIFRINEYKDVLPCKYDTCYVCGGDDSTCSGCDGVAWSGKSLDECGVCDGDGSSCACCPGFLDPPGCSTVDLCYGVSCLNGGHCNPETGKCTCQPGKTGDRCDIPDCNRNGYYEISEGTCYCDMGWAGEDCGTCDPGIAKGFRYICKPMQGGSGSGYVLIPVNSTKVKDYLSGKRQVSNLATPKLAYFPILPGEAGYDNVVRDCQCQATPIARYPSNGKHGEDERTPGNSVITMKERYGRDRYQHIKVARNQKNPSEMIRKVFTTEEVLLIASGKDVRNSQYESKWRSKRLREERGKVHPRDLEPGATEAFLEECLNSVDLMGLSMQEMAVLLAYVTENVEALEAKAQADESLCDCSNNDEINYNLWFWVVIGFLAFGLIVIIAVLFLVGQLIYGTVSDSLATTIRKREERKERKEQRASKVDSPMVGSKLPRASGSKSSKNPLFKKYTSDDSSTESPRVRLPKAIGDMRNRKKVGSKREEGM